MKSWNFGETTLSTEQLWLKSDSCNRNVTRWPTCVSARISGVTLEWKLFQTNLVKSYEFQDYILPVATEVLGCPRALAVTKFCIFCFILRSCMLLVRETWAASCVSWPSTIVFVTFCVDRWLLQRLSQHRLKLGSSDTDFKTFRVLNIMFTAYICGFIRCESTLLFEVLCC